MDTRGSGHSKQWALETMGTRGSGGNHRQWALETVGTRGSEGIIGSGHSKQWALEAVEVIIGNGH